MKVIDKGYSGVHIPQVALLEDKRYMSKCAILSIVEDLKLEDQILPPSMVKAENKALLYQDENLDWVDDDLTIARFEEVGLKIASTWTPMIHDRDMSTRSLVLKTRFIVKASEKQLYGNRISMGRISRVYINKMLWFMKSRPKYFPGVTLALSIRIITRFITTITTLGINS